MRSKLECGEHVERKIQGRDKAGFLIGLSVCGLILWGVTAAQGDGLRFADRALGDDAAKNRFDLERFALSIETAGHAADLADIGLTADDVSVRRRLLPGGAGIGDNREALLLVADSGLRTGAKTQHHLKCPDCGVVKSASLFVRATPGGARIGVEQKFSSWSDLTAMFRPSRWGSPMSAGGTLSWLNPDAWSDAPGRTAKVLAGELIVAGAVYAVLEANSGSRSKKDDPPPAETTTTRPTGGSTQPASSDPGGSTQPKPSDPGGGDPGDDESPF